MTRVELEEARERLVRGECVAFPTETFYGLAADAWNEAAVARVVDAKGRGADAAVALIVADLTQAERVAAPGAFAEGMPARRLALRFWPGPLTIVVPANPKLPAALTAGTGTIGVRVSPHPIAAALASAAGAITATSANVSGQPPCTTAAAVASQLPRLAIVDGGETSGGPASTLVSVAADPPRILRAGAISAAALSTLLPTLRP